MNIYFVRHGITTWNMEGRYQGWSDTDLTPEGLAQAWQTADYFANHSRREGIVFNALYSSPLRRARRTAAFIAERLSLPPQLWPDLSEMNGGEVEGLTLQQWQQLYPGLINDWQDSDNLDFGWPGGESRRQFRDRIRQCVDAIAAQHLPGDNVIVVTHGGVIAAYLDQNEWSDQEGPRSYEVANCSITHAQLNATPHGAELGPVGCLLRVNGVEHLQAPVVAPRPLDAAIW